MTKIVLASGSVDRKKIIEYAKIQFEILISDVDEEKYKAQLTDPIALVKKLAEVKALAAKRFLIPENEHAIVIAADTIVYHEGKIIGKPIDEHQAFTFLRRLMGSEHELITGVAITDTKSWRIIIDHDSTLVRFSNLSDDEIWGYLQTGEWMGRAGAYSLREKASLFVESIKGSPSNVLGLPMHKVNSILKREFGVNLMRTLPIY
ncbi:MAG: Maf family protein [Promethearchaeota archaeon]